MPRPLALHGAAAARHSESTTREPLRRRPRSTAVRYARPGRRGPRATAVANAVASAREAVLAAHDRTGVVVDRAPRARSRPWPRCARRPARASSSPIRFPAVQRGVAGGAHQHRLLLPRADADAHPPARPRRPGRLAPGRAPGSARRGVLRGDRRLQPRRDGEPVARCALLARGRPRATPLDPGAPDVAWLAWRWDDRPALRATRSPRFLARAVDVGPTRWSSAPSPSSPIAGARSASRPGDLVILSLPDRRRAAPPLLRPPRGRGPSPRSSRPGAPSARLREMAPRWARAPSPPSACPPLASNPSASSAVGLLEAAWFARDARVRRARGRGRAAHLGHPSGFASGCVTSLEAMLRNGARHADAIGQRAGRHRARQPAAPLLVRAGRAGAGHARARRATLVIAGPPFSHAAYAADDPRPRRHRLGADAVQVRTLLRARTSPCPRASACSASAATASRAEHVAELLRLPPRRRALPHLRPHPGGPARLHARRAPRARAPLRLRRPPARRHERVAGGPRRRLGPRRSCMSPPTR